MSVKVSIQALADYEPANVHNALQNMLAPLGGLGAFVNAGDAVVLKPNLLAPRPISRAVATHPEVIRQSANAVHEITGQNVRVTDSPGIGTAVQCARKIGIVSEDWMEVVNPDDTEWISAKAAGMWKLHVSKRLLENPVINIAKAKTHGQMIVTAAVKNMFGAVVGLEKAQWHYRIGRDPLNFAKLLVHIYQMISPKLNILDGVIGMEGNGPGSGTPRPLGLIAASENAHALDYVLCKIWDLNPMNVYSIRAAKELGLLPHEEDIEIVGPSITSFQRGPKWKMAQSASIARLVGPNWMIPVFEQLLKTTPQIDHSKCTMCMECVHHCAAKVMDAQSGRIEINTKGCISCFCCQEMCPHAAITVHNGLLARILRLG